MNNLLFRLNSELLTRQLAVSAAKDAIARAERIGKKDKQPVPPFQMEKLVAEVRYCRDQVASVEASIAGATKYPPL